MVGMVSRVEVLEWFQFWELSGIGEWFLIHEAASLHEWEGFYFDLEVTFEFESGARIYRFVKQWWSDVFVKLEKTVGAGEQGEEAVLVGEQEVWEEQAECLVVVNLFWGEF